MTRDERRAIRIRTIQRRLKRLFWLRDGIRHPSIFAKYNGVCSCGLCDCHKQSGQADYRRLEEARRHGDMEPPDAEC